MPQIDTSDVSFHYEEAGGTNFNYAGVTITNGETSKATVTPTAVCRPRWLPGLPCRGPGIAHIILAVTDNGSPALTSYRRIVVTVHE